jgi:hypothetical protein
MSKSEAVILVRNLTRTPANIERSIRAVRQKPKLLDSMFAAVSAKEARPKFDASKAVRLLAERAPELVYPHFGRLQKLLRHENSIIRWNAMLALGSLAPVDTRRRLDRMLAEYLAPICGKHLIDASNTIRGATVIAMAKPHLADKIANSVMAVEHATYATPECRNVAIGHAIKSLSRLYPMVQDKNAVQDFVSRQTKNPRHAVRKKAEQFLRKLQAHAVSREQARVRG